MGRFQRKRKGRPLKAQEIVTHPADQSKLTKFYFASAQDTTPPVIAHHQTTAHESESSEGPNEDQWRFAHLDNSESESVLGDHNWVEYEEGEEGRGMVVDPDPRDADARTLHADDAAGGYGSDGVGDDGHERANAPPGAHGQNLDDQDLVRELLDEGEEDSHSDDDDAEGEEDELELEKDTASPQVQFIREVLREVIESRERYVDDDGNTYELYTVLVDGKLWFSPPDPCASMTDFGAGAFSLQAAFVWDPESVGGILCCPQCNGTSLESNGWRHARRVLTVDGMYFIISRQFICKSCRNAKRSV